MRTRTTSSKRLSRPRHARCARRSPSTSGSRACRARRVRCDRDRRLQDGQPAQRARRASSTRASQDVRVTGDPEVIEAADGIVLPGVGAFRDATRNLRESGVEPIIRHRVGAGTPFLGICLGLQLLADIGYEDGEWAGLGLVPGTCEKLAPGVKIPHIGWNTVEYPRDCPLFDGIPESTAFYFVHSYRLVPRDSDVDHRLDRVRRAVLLGGAEGEPVRGAVPSREVLDDGAAAARQLRADRGRSARMIVFPAIDILGGQAVRLRQGRLRPGDHVQRGPGRAGARVGRAGRRVDPRGRPGRRARRRAGQHRRRSSGSCARSAFRCRWAAGSAASRR